MTQMLQRFLNSRSEDLIIVDEKDVSRHACGLGMD